MEKKKICFGGVKLGFFLSGIGKKPILFGIGNGAKFRPLNWVIKSPEQTSQILGKLFS